jgi:hypothetical protein
MFYAISLGTSQKTLRSEAYVGELFKGSREVRRAALVDPTIAGTCRHQGKLRNIASQNGFYQRTLATCLAIAVNERRLKRIVLLDCYKILHYTSGNSFLTTTLSLHFRSALPMHHNLFRYLIILFICTRTPRSCKHS